MDPNFVTLSHLLIASIGDDGHRALARSARRRFERYFRDPKNRDYWCSCRNVLSHVIMESTSGARAKQIARAMWPAFTDWVRP